MFAGPCIAGTAATSGSAGWDRGSWSRRNSFAGSKDTNRFRLSSKNWKLWRRLSRGLSNGERRRRVGYAGVATFNGVPGILLTAANGAQLSIPSATAAPGTTILLPVSFESQSASATGIQFDLQYDNSALSLSATVGE